MYVVYTSTLWVCVFLVRAFFFHFLFFHFLSVFVSLCSYSLWTCLRISLSLERGDNNRALKEP